MSKQAVKQYAPFLVLITIAIIALFAPSLPNFNNGGKYSSADVAWMIVATALVFLMTPGLKCIAGLHQGNRLIIHNIINSIANLLTKIASDRVTAMLS